jgi:hypothetical protein
VASKTLIFPEDEGTFVRAPTRISNDLPAHIKGAAYWVVYGEHFGKSQYHVEISHGTELPVEFINHRWYILRWDIQEGYYITKKDWKLPIGEYDTGYYLLTDPEHPEYQHPSPLEARVTSDPESTLTTQSPQDRIDDSAVDI